METSSGAAAPAPRNCTDADGRHLSTRAARRVFQERQRMMKLLDSKPPSAVEVLLVRHGETDWNVDYRLQGQLDPPLNEVGLKQAHMVGEHFKSIDDIAALYSSDLCRCTQTAESVSSATTLTVTTTPLLRERNLGVLQGLTAKEAPLKEPGAWAALLSSDRSSKVPGGGESEEEMYERVTQAVEEIASRHAGQRVVCIVHGGVLAQLHRRAAGHDFRGSNVNCGINRLLISGSRWDVLQWGVTSHLSGIGFSATAFGGDSNSA